MNVDTIDERLRARAQDQLKDEAKRATEPASAALMYSNGQTTLSGIDRRCVTDGNNESLVNIRLTTGQLILALRQAIYEQHVKQREEEALSKFIGDVSALRGDIDDLYAITDDLENRNP